MYQTSIQTILQAYNISVQAESYGNGHINDTYIVESNPRYILQRINTSIFRNPDELMDNIENVTSFLREKITAEGGDPERETLTVVNTAAGKNYSVAGLYSKAKVWPDLVNFQFVQVDDTTLEVRGVCKSEPSHVLSSLCVRLHEFMTEMGCPEARFTWSEEPLIPNERGGKIPLYVNIQD